MLFTYARHTIGVVVVVCALSLIACGNSAETTPAEDGDADVVDVTDADPEPEVEEEEPCGEDECCLPDARYIDDKPLGGEVDTSCLRDLNCEEIMVICHRGFNLETPENSVPGFQAAIDLGCDMLEVDVRETSDGKLVVMHDDTVDRTTDGSGNVDEMTLAEIEQLRLRWDGEISELRVPTFQELLDMTDGKSLIYIDWKSADPQRMSDLLVQNNAVDRVLVYASSRTRLDGLHAINPDILILPAIEMDEPDVSAVLQRFNTTVVQIPTMVANGRVEIIQRTREAGGKVNQCQLGAADLAAEFACDVSQWQRGIDDGLNAMQTDIANLMLPLAKGWQ